MLGVKNIFSPGAELRSTVQVLIYEALFRGPKIPNVGIQMAGGMIFIHAQN
jgi:hypothetical protein